MPNVSEIFIFAGRRLLDPQHPLSLLGITDGSIVQLHLKEVVYLRQQCSLLT